MSRSPGQQKFFGIPDSSKTKDYFLILSSFINWTMIILLAISLGWLSLHPVWAADGNLDLSFDPGAGVSRFPILWAPGVYNDGSGKMLIAGDITTVNGQPCTSIARLNADGSLDASFNATINGTVYSLILLNPNQANSQMLIIGEFTIASDSGQYYCLARLNSDGSVDDSFGHAFQTPKGVNAITIQTVSPGGYNTILVGGTCMGIGDGNNTYYLVRLDMNGNLMNGTPYDVKLADAGAYVRNLQLDGATQNVRMCAMVPRLPGRTHTDYLTLIAPNNTITPLIGDEIIDGPILFYAADSSGRPVIAGAFKNVYGNPMSGVARFLAGGGWTVDPTFQIGTGAADFVQRLNIDNGKIVLAGPFTSFNGTPCGYMVRLNDSGSVDTTFNQGGSGADERIWTMFKRGTDNTWIILGPFRHFNGESRQGVANLTVDGALNAQYATVTTGNTKPAEVNAIVVQSDGKIIIGGSFTGYAGRFHRRLARLNPDGSVDASYNPDLGGNAYKLAIQNDGKLLVSGTFNYAKGYFSRSGLARFNTNGELDRSFWPIMWDPMSWWADNGPVAPLPNGQILITGLFSYVNYTPVNNEIALLNANGTLDTSFNAQISMAGANACNVDNVMPCGDKYVVTGKAWYPQPPNGGYFHRFLTRLTSTGAVDTSFTATGAVPHINVLTSSTDMDMDMITRIKILQDGKILVASDFTQIEDGTPNPPQRQWIARFAANGLFDNTFDTSSCSDWNPPGYMALGVQHNGRILVGGVTISRLYPDGTFDKVFDQGRGSGVNYGSVYCMAVLPTGKAYLGGGFTTYNGVSRPGIARILAGGSSNSTIQYLLLQ